MTESDYIVVHFLTFSVGLVICTNGTCVLLRQDEESGEIAFYMKGADVVMRNVVQYNDWMDEEVSSKAYCSTFAYCFLSLNRVHRRLVWPFY